MPTHRIHLTGLIPAFAAAVDRLLAHAEALEYAPILTEGFRTIERQNRLYAQGRTTPGPIVTKAKGGESAHNYGLAVDITTKYGYDSKTQRAIHELAKEHGFATISWDLPHVEAPNWKAIKTRLTSPSATKPG